jgi:glycine/D-amino acid oxidase-like deaminating enzyme
LKNDPNAATPAAHGICTIKGILESDTERFRAQLKGHRGFERWLQEWERFLGRPRPTHVWEGGVREIFTGLREFQSEFGRIYRKDFVGAKDVNLSVGHKRDFAEAFYPGDFWIDPEYLISVYSESCLRLGVTFEDKLVTSVSSDRSSLTVRCEEGFSTEAEGVVVCGGSGASKIIIEGASISEDLYAVGGYTFKARTNQKDRCYVKKMTGFAVKNKILHLGSTSEQPVRLDSENTSVRWRSPAEEQAISRALYVEACGGGSVGENSGELLSLQTRWGVRVRTRHRMPLIKQILATGRGGVWVNTGYYKSGIILSWLMAEDLSEKIAACVTGEQSPCFSSR